MAHTFEIAKTKNDSFLIRFKYNSEIMVWSESYTARASAQNCIDSLKKNAPSAAVVDLTKGETGTGYRFEIVAASNGQPFVRFVASNGETMVRSETYASKAGAQNCIESVKSNGPAAPVMDAA